MPSALISPPIQTVLRDLGILLHIPGVMALVTLPLCFLAGEFYAIVPFSLTAIVAFAAGQLLYRVFQKADISNLRFALITVALGWFLIPSIGAIPFKLIAVELAQMNAISPTLLEFQDIWNALFESVSGFTSTGLSVALNPAELPYSLQWWRSFSEWIGGVGVIVLMVALLDPGTDAYHLYTAEGRNKLIGLTVRETVRKIWWIYLIYTAGSIVWFRIVGMPWWEALNHALTAISTGGFAVTNDSIAVYSPTIQLAIVPVMILGAIGFSAHHQLLRRRRWQVLWQSDQYKALWILLSAGILLLMFENRWSNEQSTWVDAVFQWVSALGTCGFETVDLQAWSIGAKLLLTAAMIVGGASGSTVGGIKLTRAVILFQGISWRFHRLWLRPHQIMRYKIDNQVIFRQDVVQRIESAATLATLWLLCIAVGIFILLHVVPSEYNLDDILFETASALGSVGLSIGITQPDLSWIGKLVLIVLMWMGRLEIIPVLLLLFVPLGQLKATLNQHVRF